MGLLLTMRPGGPALARHPKATMAPAAHPPDAPPVGFPPAAVLVPLAYLVLVACGPRVSTAPPAPLADGSFELYRELTSGMAATTTRILVRETGEVVGVSLCREGRRLEDACFVSLGVNPGPTTMLCGRSQAPIVRGRAPAREIAALGRILRSDAFAALHDEYYEQVADAGSFVLRVRIAGRIEKTIRYSPWMALEKEAAGKQLDDHLVSLFESLEDIDMGCVSPEDGARAVQ
jgi:hypothetical protein